MVETLLALVVVLLANKVVNEQYLVMPIALLGVVAAVDPARRSLLRAFTWGGLASAVLVGFHFVTFLPPDIAPPWLRPEEFVAGVAGALDVPVLLVVAAPHVLALAALVPAMVLSVRLVHPELRGGVQTLARVLDRLRLVGAQVDHSRGEALHPAAKLVLERAEGLPPDEADKQS